MNRPLVVCTLLWISGYALAYLFNLGWLSLYVSLLLAIAMVIYWGLGLKFRIGVCAVLLVLIGAGYYENYDQANRSDISLPHDAEGAGEASMVLAGFIASRVEVDGDKASFTLMVESQQQEKQEDESSKLGAKPKSVKEPIAVNVKLLTREEQQRAYSWQRADRVVLQGVVKLPSKARNFDGFDYRDYLRLQHIHWTVSVKGIASVQVTQPQTWTFESILRWNDQFRMILAQRISDIFPAAQGGFMQSMLIGLTDDMDPVQFQQFSQLGLTHILAVSGLNVAVFLACLLWILRKLRFTRETCILTAIALMPLYIALTGGSPSIVRAGLMAMIGLYAAYRHTLKDGLHSVLFVGFVMLLWDPYYLLDVSFQLSFLVTIGLIVGVPPVNTILPIRSQLWKNTLSISLVAQLISFPVSIYYFNQLSLLSLAANLCLVPVFSMVTMPGGTAALVIGFIYVPAGQALAWLVAKVNDWVFMVVSISSKWDGFQTIWPSPSISWMIAYYMVLTFLVGVLIRLKNEHHKAAEPMLKAVRPGWNLERNSQMQWNWMKKKLPLPLASISLIALLVYAYVPDRWHSAGEGHVDFIDVGQGDSILIRSPISRSVILIDGGGTVSFHKPGEEWKLRKSPYEVGSKLLVPLLKKRGIQQIDYLIISHEDADHIGGLQAVLEQIPVKQLVYNGTFKPGTAVEKLFQTALNKQVKLVKAIAGNTLKVDASTELLVLHPIPGPAAVELHIEKEQNGQSVVLMMRMGNTRWLFTGDMDQAAETAVAQMTAAYKSVDNTHTSSLQDAKEKPLNLPELMLQGPIDVLKVAHHGSKTSTSNNWIQAYQPKMAVISVGASNVYGHPHPTVVERLQQHGIQIMRTDRMGEVQMTVNNGEIKVRTKLEMN
ncbi:DNA internalization-related competence protein ComEC/Rec2 [Paenibacillus sp. FSL H7-0331]|uniref:DNA internalization-related competence protein ComEC/Rec2 n=1 Tax=Paenibacillus sp. FSL H7-0331 TaxID=1920421 RepID=UPI00096F9EF7|nr:DNA internalization-related competence protein ComEC/Rec2 [Paenibacillus sp. FSL H7-0331]OMF18286.1 DNA internalization-related competence protein ComEC/Rec2 [Paenibacillus sp. FSL H7-0331]